MNTKSKMQWVSFIYAAFGLSGCVAPTGGVGSSIATLMQNAALPANTPIPEMIMTPTPTATPVPGATTLSLAAYQELAQSLSLPAGIKYRYGNAAAVNNAGVPTQYRPVDKHYDNNGNGAGWDYELGSIDATQNDFASAHANLLYIPDQSGAEGIDTIQQTLMGTGTFSEKPQLAWVYYGGGHPAPEAKNYTAVNGGTTIRQPIALGRSYGFFDWGSNDIVGFQDGLLAAFGTHTGPGKASLKLPANKVPTGVTITSNNELALVTVWDTSVQKGQVAVVALGTGLSFWGDWNAVYPGIRNRGVFSFMKLLGYVDLPGMTQPTEISAATDYSASLDNLNGWMSSPDGTNGRYHEEQLNLSNETNRQSFISGPNKNRISRAGFAVITSRAENKVAFLDLKPLLDYYHRMYFGNRVDFDSTQILGQASDQWPYSFSHTAGIAPVVAKILSLSHAPSAVRVSVAPGVNQAYVATEEGTLHIYSVGGYGASIGGTPSDVAEVGSVFVGANPTSIAHIKNQWWGYHTIADQLMVVVRGERAIKWVQIAGNTATVFKTLKDTRLIDPISVEDVDYHGTEAPILTVADYAGRQIVNYRYGHVIYHTNGGANYGMGSDGNAEFECGGWYPVTGTPFQVSGANVP